MSIRPNGWNCPDKHGKGRNPMSPNMIKRSVILLHVFFGLGEVGVVFGWSCVQQQQGHKVCSPPVSLAEGKNLPFLGVDLGWSKVVNFKDQILYDFVTRRAFNLEKRDMMEGMLNDCDKGWVLLERRSFFIHIWMHEQATLKALRSPHICIWLYDDVLFIWIVPMFATVGISIKCVMSCTIILLMITRNTNTFEARFRKKAHVCSSSLWRSNCSWPLWPLFPPGFIGMKNATPPQFSGCFSFFELFCRMVAVNYVSEAWRSEL